MALNKNSRNKNAKLLWNPYKDSGRENAQNELVVDKYGFIPKSVWNIKRSQRLVAYVNDVIGKGSFKDKGKGGKKGETKLSLFNPDVVMQIIKYYTLKGDIIVAPYGSRGVIGIMAYLCGRDSYSCDIVPEYMNQIKYSISLIKEQIGDDETVLEAFLCDAVTSKVTGIRSVTDKGWSALNRKTRKFKSNFADCIIFNPPYFNVERYKSVDGQLSDNNDYDTFLEQYALAIKQHFRILKPDGFAIAVVNDFRKNDMFYNFHGDTIDLCKAAGFVHHDIIINELNGQAMQAIGSFEKMGLKIMPKCHEYILVFRKPNEDGDSKAYRKKWVN